MTIAILNFGSGNLNSVYNMIDYLGFDCKITNDESIINTSTHIILPGVGSYEGLMSKIKKNDIDLLHEQIHVKKKPFLGICIGMQILSTTGNEFGKHKGLNWVGGNVSKIESDKLPHIGWNNIIIKRNSIPTKNLDDESSFYFANSHHFRPKNSNHVVAETFYELSFCSIIEKENIFGVQFHPEISQKAGELLLNNFLNIKC